MKQAPNGLTRRGLGVAIAAAGAVTSTLAQQPASTEDLASSAREQVKTTSETLRKFKVPTATEPSFTFRP